jgi:hypothetical protein
LESDAGLETHPDHPDPSVHVGLQQLELHAFLVCDKGKIFLGTVQRSRNAGDWSKCSSHGEFLLEVVIRTLKYTPQILTF